MSVLDKAPDSQDQKVFAPPHFPLSGEELQTATRTLLEETIGVPSEVTEARVAEFDDIWQAGWQQEPDHRRFESPPESSPFSVFSSRGWKIHIAFEKGKEKEVSQFLYGAGLYFKTQADMGSWFNGVKESGSTIYIGGEDCMENVVRHVEKLGGLLTGGPEYPQPVNGKRVRLGSGSDVEIRPKIMARFDVAKTDQGRSGKYAEDGLPSWVNAYGLLSALPLLKPDAEKLMELEQSTRSINVLFDFFRSAQHRCQEELVKDFGEDYVLGTANEWIMRAN